MLRLIVMALLLANTGYLAWSRGWLATYGLAPVSQSEPQRVAQQLRPEALRLLTASEARLLEAGTLLSAAPVATPVIAAECLQAGLFNDQQATALRPLLQSSLLPGSWSLESSVEPERWIVYMGKYADEEALDKKRGELRRLGVSFEPLINPVLAPGLSLGHFSSQAEAQSQLASVAARRVRSARVLRERAEVTGQLLKLPAVSASLRGQLEALKPQLQGFTLRACS